MSPLEIFISEIPDAVKFTGGLIITTISFAWWSIYERRVLRNDAASRRRSNYISQ